MKKITTKKDYYVAMSEIEGFLAKGFDKLTREEDNRLAELSVEVSAYEKAYFPMPVKHELAVIVDAYMKENNLTRQKLALLLGVGNSTLSEILNKKRPITFDFAKKLHSKLHLDGNLIFELA